MTNQKLREALDACITQMEQSEALFENDHEFLEALEEARSARDEADREAEAQRAQMRAQNLAALPLRAYVDNSWNESPDAPPVVMIIRGERGYTPVATTQSADELNAKIGVTKAQASAMHAGSMFGWHLPGANPAAYEGKDHKSVRQYDQFHVTPVVEYQDPDGSFDIEEASSYELAVLKAKELKGNAFFAIYGSMQGEPLEHLCDRIDAEAAAKTASRLVGREVKPSLTRQVITRESASQTVRTQAWLDPAERGKHFPIKEAPNTTPRCGSGPGL